MPIRPKTLRPILQGLVRQSDRRKRERDAFYSGMTWRRLRQQFLIDNPLCLDCLAVDVLTPAKVAHHEEERLHRPDLSLDAANLTALCNSCHTKRHNLKAGMTPTPGGG
jgi:5-methylcytosine-specific restriction protein A